MLDSTLDLHFDTPDLSQHAPDLISKRINFHLQQESTVYQVRWIIEKLVLTRQLASQHMSGLPQNQKIKTLDAPLKVGILLHDLFPESSENLCWAMLNHLLYDKLLSIDQIEIISRKKDLPKYAPCEFQKVKVTWNFQDLNYIHAFDLVVVCGTCMNVPMLKDLFSNQNLYQTIIVMTIAGVLLKRIQSILDSELVIMCNFSKITYNLVNDVRSPNILRMDNLPLNLVFPDLELLNQYFTAYCLRAGLKTQQSADVAAKALPKNEAKAREEFDKSAPRLKYISNFQ